VFCTCRILPEGLKFVENFPLRDIHTLEVPSKKSELASTRMFNKVRGVLKVKVDAQHTCIDMYMYVCTYTYTYINVEGLSSEPVLQCVKKSDLMLNQLRVVLRISVAVCACYLSRVGLLVH